MAPYRRNKKLIYFFSLILAAETLLRTVMPAMNSLFRRESTYLIVTPSSKKIRQSKLSKRNYLSSPVTAEESAVLTAKDDSNMTAAVCHKTLFGDRVDISKILGFVSYYRLLGFDHIFMHYQSHIGENDRFGELDALPYVTMTPYDGGGAHAGQRIVGPICKEQLAKDYDWVFTIDADEYLWFNENMNVKDFLHRYNANYTYLSIPKWQYTRLHELGYDGVPDSGFDLDRFGFTPAINYCEGDPGNLYCPYQKGRCKIISKPSKWGYCGYHGIFKVLEENEDAVHLSQDVAQIKEWPHFFHPYHPNVRTSKDTFDVYDEGEIRLSHGMKTHPVKEDGGLPMKFDHGLAPWMSYVASGCGRLGTTVSLNS